MDAIKNPFSPGAGSPPPELVGRDPILEQARILLGRIKAKKPEKSMLLTGLRGVGKTVLLNEIERLAKKQEYRTIAIEAHEDTAIPGTGIAGDQGRCSLGKYRYAWPTEVPQNRE
jgi:Cdc6-like AAA superfamily ATPase